MKNVYDIRFEQNLIYIFPEKGHSLSQKTSYTIHSETAIIIYLYYIDTLQRYYNYIENIPLDMDIYIISSRKDVLKEVYQYMTISARRNVSYTLKENRGHDVSALLISGRDIVSKYKYICFLHDKKEHSEQKKKDVEIWIENLWGNQIGSRDYIENILCLFEKNNNLGILAPPEPIGDYFNTWYGYGWCDSYEITKEIANRLDLRTDIRWDKPPVTFGTILWFRSSALQKLFDAGWKYSDFDDSRLLSEDNYLSYGIERIFAYVAQDAGYFTGTSMSTSYAAKQTNYLQYTTKQILSAANYFFPISNMHDLQCYEKNKNKVIEFAKSHKNIYLYGAGDMGRLCMVLLRSENISPVAYIVSGKSSNDLVQCSQVISVDKFEDMKYIAVIITVYNISIQREIINVLKNKGCINYIVFWKF